MKCKQSVSLFSTALLELFMMKVNAKNHIGIEDLVCPITLELFRDPVTAADGYVYEREAITKWILERGTSPFTRQPLQVNDLQPNDRYKHLAEKYRKKNERSNKFRTCCQCTPRPKPVDPAANNTRNLLITIMSLLLLPIILILGIIFGINNSYPADIYVTSAYSGAFTSNSSTYLVNSTYSLFYTYSTKYYYEKTEVIVSKGGFYGFERINGYYVSNIDLYKNSFNSTNILINRMTYEYGSNETSKNSFGVLLQPEKYILIIASRYSSTDSFSVLVTGPASVTFF